MRIVFGSNMTKCHFQKNNCKCCVDPFCDVMEGPVSVSSYAASDIDLFLSTFVHYSTDIVVIINAFLIHMSVFAGQGTSVSFNPKFSMNRGLNSEWMAW